MEPTLVEKILAGTAVGVNYASISDVLPGNLNNTADDIQGNRQNFVLGIIRTVLILLFVVIGIVGVVYAAMAGVKYIRSEGEEQAIQDAQEAIKAVVIGFAAVFIGVIGVILVSSIIGASGDVSGPLACFLSPSPETCQ